MTREPVAILAVVRAILVALAAIGVLALTDAEIEEALAGIGAFWITIEIIITAIQRSRVTPVADPRLESNKR